MRIPQRFTPIDVFNLKNWLLRFKLAYKVFKGDVDVLDWEND